MTYQVVKSGKIWAVIEHETGKVRAFRRDYRRALELARAWTNGGGLH